MAENNIEQENIGKTFNAKSAVVARKKIGDEKYNAIVNLFDNNDPHLTSQAPKKCLEFECKGVLIDSLNVKFLLGGNDIIINDLETIKVLKEDGFIKITK